MTFYEISAKMLRVNFNRYRLYFFCNLFAVSLFECFASIFTNSSFMDGTNVNSLISSNIYFPSMLAALFLVLFLPVSCQAFFAARKQEYGILFSLGMSPKEAFRNMMLENMVIAGMALAAALAAGTVLSGFFFAVINYGIGIKGVQWQFCPASYKITVLLYLVVMAAAFLWNAVGTLREKIGTLLKAQYRCGKKSLTERILDRCRPGYVEKHLAEWSFVRRHNNAWRIRYGFGTIIIACAVMLVSICVTMYPAFLRDAENESPYDMAYAEIYGMNGAPLQEVRDILAEHGVSVEHMVQMPYLRDAGFNYLPVAKVNQYFGCEYQVEEGQFLNLFQYDLQNGYEYDMQPVSSVAISGNQELHSVGSEVKILFNRNAAFADRTLIVSDADYEKMEEDAQYVPGTANLFAFVEWRKSNEGVCAVQEYLQSCNQVDEAQEHYYKLSSKVERYLEARKSGLFLNFLMAFVIGLMLMSEYLLIHFRVQAELEENSRAVNSLQMIGMTEEEIVKCLRYKNRMRFLPPVILGTVLAIFPSFYYNEVYGSGYLGVFVGILFGTIMAMVEIISVKWYSQKEFAGIRRLL